MSRIGKKPIDVPSGVEVTINGNNVKVKGPKGTLERTIHESMNIVREGNVILVNPKASDNSTRNFHGLSRTLISNMVEGCSKGFTKSLSLIGVGYRATLKGKQLNLTLGYSHPIEFDAPEGIDFAVEKQTKVTISGASKEVVGETAAKIRSLRPPEPYHGKGVRYTDEQIITKVGKAAGKK